MAAYKKVPHCIKTQQYTVDELSELFRIAKTYKETGESSSARGKIMTTLFYEPSTRTRLSFEAAMLRLGGRVISTDNAGQFSSAAKGETLEDTIRVVSEYCDVIVLRHTDEDAAERAINYSAHIPVINGGCGPNKDRPHYMHLAQHPTQALLDLYTIEEHFGYITSLRVAFVGDLKNGRTVRSLAYLLGKYHGVKIKFVAPGNLAVGDDIKDYLKRHNVEYQEYGNLASVIDQVDVVYMTRLQEERMTGSSELSASMDRIRLGTSYAMTEALAAKMHDNAIILHPLPRIDEISTAVDRMKQAKYFDQARNGLYVRMALLHQMFN
ncbi:MAG: aspartate carbamoyltransferase 1, chloroplastic-like [Candidatus Adlerbacteria bacterium]|nr:aspartate carbamoyltransferase 1, chloroplastic-like [Candidatus Adlerbacteria bacterium]